MYNYTDMRGTVSQNSHVMNNKTEVKTMLKIHPSGTIAQISVTKKVKNLKKHKKNIKSVKTQKNYKNERKSNKKLKKCRKNKIKMKKMSKTSKNKQKNNKTTKKLKNTIKYKKIHKKSKMKNEINLKPIHFCILVSLLISPPRVHQLKFHLENVSKTQQMSTTTITHSTNTENYQLENHFEVRGTRTTTTGSWNNQFTNKIKLKWTDHSWWPSNKVKIGK